MKTKSPGLYLMLTNGHIGVFNRMFANTKAEEWRRCTCDKIYFNTAEMEHGQRFCVPPKRRTINWNAQTGYPMLVGGGINTDDQINQYGIFKAKEIGADPRRLKVWSDWVDAMWPKNASANESWPKERPGEWAHIRDICPAL